MIDENFPDYILLKIRKNLKIGLYDIWCAWKELNPQPSDPKSDALSS